MKKIIAAFTSAYLDPFITTFLEKVTSEGNRVLVKSLLHKPTPFEVGHGEKRLNRSIDLMIDNLRIFGCFMADFITYYYDLERTVFKGITNEGHLIDLPVVSNPFVSRSSLCTFVLDLILASGTRMEDMAKILQKQCREQSLGLESNIVKIRERLSAEELGIPEEVFQQHLQHKPSFLSDSRVEKSHLMGLGDWLNKKDKWDDDTEVKMGKFLETHSVQHASGFAGEKKLDDSTRRLKFKSVSKETQTSLTATLQGIASSSLPTEDVNPRLTQDLSRLQQASLNRVQDSRNPSTIDPATLNLHQLSQRMLNCSLSMFNDLTHIANHVSLLEDTMQEASKSLLDLFIINQQKPNSYELFSDAISILKKMPAAKTPCAKIRLLFSSLLTAIQEMRRAYTDQNPGTETKVHITQEILLSVLIYLVLRAEGVGLLSDYTMLKVFLVFDKDFLLSKLVYLLKSAIKSINRMGVLLAKV